MLRVSRTFGIQSYADSPELYRLIPNYLAKKNIIFALAGDDPVP